MRSCRGIAPAHHGLCISCDRVSALSVMWLATRAVRPGSPVLNGWRQEGAPHRKRPPLAQMGILERSLPRLFPAGRRAAKRCREVSRGSPDRHSLLSDRARRTLSEKEESCRSGWTENQQFCLNLRIEFVG